MKSLYWNQLEIVVKATYGLHPNEYFEILLNILGKKPDDKVFRASFKFPRHIWDQRFADFNRFSQ